MYQATMWTHLPPSDCQRARQAVSLRLDGELSELEGLWLDGHLGGCAHCRAYDVDTEAFTGALRGAVLDRPAAVFVLPRRRSRGSLVRLAAAASVLVTAASSAA